jgi:hypothetical protein
MTFIKKNITLHLKIHLDRTKQQKTKLKKYDLSEKL